MTIIRLILFDAGKKWSIVSNTVARNGPNKVDVTNSPFEPFSLFLFIFWTSAYRNRSMSLWNSLYVQAFDFVFIKFYCQFFSFPFLFLVSGKHWVAVDDGVQMTLIWCVATSTAKHLWSAFYAKCLTLAIDVKNQVLAISGEKNW